MRILLAATMVTSLVMAMSHSTSAAELESLIGRKIDGFELKDFRGETHRLSDYADSKLVVVAFLGTECPLAKLYGPRMQQLNEEFASQGVAFIGINSNRQDSITEMANHARIHNMEFPFLKDVGNHVADQFGATRTPQIFVLDADRGIRYHGRIDKQYSFGTGVGYAAPKLERRDLAVALEELLAGKEVSVAVTEARGCLIGRVREVNDDSEVTYSNQVARIFQDRCVGCHREGQIAPFAMTNYDEVAGWGEMIAEVVGESRMPPWHAAPKHGVFANDSRLSSEEQEMIFEWVANGCPEGDVANLPEPREYPVGWMMPQEPDQVIYFGDKPVSIKAEGVEAYRHYMVDPGFTEDKWVTWAECMPGNPQVVHHIIVFIRPPGRKARSRSEDPDIRGFGFLAGFAPGTRPIEFPPGMAKKIPAGSQLVFQMHYTPCGSPQEDLSSVGLVFVDPAEITHQVSTTATSNHTFAIPPGAFNHKVEATHTFTRDTTLLSMFPHMHIRGKAFRYEATYPDGSHEILLDVPQYDFNWQNSFILAEPKALPKGTEIHCTAWFDNSSDNPSNPDPTEEVRWGPQTWHEMMIGWYDIAFPVAQADKIYKKAVKAEGLESAEGESGSD